MSRRGRPRLPTAVKKARGTYRKDRSLPREMTPPAAVPGVPAWLDEEGLAEWNRVVPVLEQLGVLTELDQVALEHYCAAVSLATRATRRYQRDGLLVGGRPHPLIKVAKDARTQALRLATEFGLTPASRSRIDARDPAAAVQTSVRSVDETESFLFPKPKLVI